ncbi:hypothetical protein M407DRAFT_4200 [Tulasnella calospora MUT 4182]|uniref:Uncharacterized protein n=1 Tax=Tulasnella calospora MUT 4182 TaxID=1051891 RepID=A0A0C3QVZ0_9AGAM|nr:hypothetical protein M407DRAFT_4200 [Tulasnella calospora MUT 4182]
MSLRKPSPRPLLNLILHLSVDSSINLSPPSARYSLEDLEQKKRTQNLLRLGVPYIMDKNGKPSDLREVDGRLFNTTSERYMLPGEETFVMATNPWAEGGSHSLGVKDYGALCADIAEVLNPQGIFISVEGDAGLYDKNKVKYGPQKEGDSDFSWSHELTMAYIEATRKRNPGFSDLNKVAEILETTSGDPWAGIEGTTFFLPCGPYESCNETERIAGRLMHQSVLKVPKALKALLLASGYDAEYCQPPVGDGAG